MDGWISFPGRQVAKAFRAASKWENKKIQATNMPSPPIPFHLTMPAVHDVHWYLHFVRSHLWSWGVLHMLWCVKTAESPLNGISINSRHRQHLTGRTHAHNYYWTQQEQEATHSLWPAVSWNPLSEAKQNHVRGLNACQRVCFMLNLIK